MEKNQFIVKNDIEEFLRHLVIERDIFNRNVPFDQWKSTYECVKGVQDQIDLTLKHWKRSGNFKEIAKEPLAELKSQTNEFVKKCTKKGQKRGDWLGGSDECQALLDDFRANTRPIIQKLINHLEVENSVRIDIEKML